MNLQGQMVNQEHSGGLTISQCWQEFFEVNEQRFEDGIEPPLTDSQIRAKILARFPDRTFSAHLMAVKRVRAGFNAGRLIGGEKPIYASYRYIRDGDKFFRTTARGRKLVEWQQKRNSSA